MKIAFGGLDVGKKFYQIKEGSLTDLDTVFIKLPAVQLTDKKTWDSVKCLPSVAENNGNFNAAVVEGPDGTEGSYAFFRDKVPIYTANHRC